MPLILVPPYKLKTALLAALQKVYSVWSGSDLNGSLSNANLTSTTGNNLKGARSEVGVTSGKHYWEITVVNMNSWGMIGIASLAAHNSSTPYNHSESIYIFHNSIYGGGSNQLGGPFAVPNGTVLGFALDADARTLTVYADGVLKLRRTVVVTATSKIYAATAVGNYNTGAVFTANYGATAFAYSVPNGFNAGLYDEGGVSMYIQAGSVGGTLATPIIQTRKGKNQWSSNSANFTATSMPIAFSNNIIVKYDFDCLISEQDAIVAAGYITQPQQAPNPQFSAYFAVRGIQKRFRVERNGLNAVLDLVD